MSSLNHIEDFSPRHDPSGFVILLPTSYVALGIFIRSVRLKTHQSL